MALDKWLGVEPIHPYFYYDYESNLAVWLKDKPEGAIKLTSVKWRGESIEVQLLSNRQSGPRDTSEPSPPEQNNVTGFMQLLKSNLQKAVRRGLTEIAVKTSKTMMAYDFNTFIRRLFIIVIEDTQAHIGLNEIMWMTVASASAPWWKPSKSQKDWLLGFVKMLCLNPIFDTEVLDFKMGQKFKMREHLKSINGLELKEKSFIYSCAFRISYGGMVGDMSMLANSCKVWHHRFKNHLNLRGPAIEPIEGSEIYLVSRQDILNEAIDFHSHPTILSELEKEFPEFDKYSIKKAIWHHNSAYNFRDTYKQNNDYIVLWNKIKDSVWRIQTNTFGKFKF